MCRLRLGGKQASCYVLRLFVVKPRITYTVELRI